MKLTTLLFVLCFSFFSFAQLGNLNINNALIVTSLKNQEDRFTLEATLAEIFANCGIKNKVSLNYIKYGSDNKFRLTDSIKTLLASQGISNVVVVSIRGYDRNYDLSKKALPLEEDLAADNLFTLYKEDLVSITFEFHVYIDGKFAGSDLLKLGSVGSKETVLKKLRKKLTKRILRKWRG